MLTSKGDLAIAELVFYLPIWVITVIICRRHGWNRSAGWVFLFLFVWMRLVSSISGIIADTNPHNIGAIITSAVMNAGGTSTLLMTQIGILKRLNSGVSRRIRKIPDFTFTLAVVALLALLGVAIASGVYLFSTNPDRQALGVILSQAAGGLSIGVFGLMVLALAWTSINFRLLMIEDRVLLYASWVALPFLIARVVYLACLSFRVNTVLFNYVTGNIYVMAFMSAVPEFIVVIVFLSAGWIAPPLKKIEHSEVREEPIIRKGDIEAHETELGFINRS